MRSVSFSLLILLAACSDHKISTYTQPPAVTIQTPADGSELDEGVPIALRGIVQDDKYDESPDLMEATWSVNGSPICEGSVVAEGGFADCTHIFDGSGDVTLALRVTNPDGATSQAEVSVTILPNSAPSISIIKPLASGIFYNDYPILFESRVADGEDDATSLSVGWTSALDGALTMGGSISSDGIHTGEALLSSGTHDLIATVTDTTGLTASATTRVVVRGPNNPPDCEILSPAMDAVFDLGETIEFEATAIDEDIDETDLMVVWTSDKDGELARTAPNSLGEVLSAVESDLLQQTVHTITLSVTDEVGGNCTDSVRIKVGSGPDVEILNPLTGEWYNEGVSISFVGTATDDEDDSADLGISWSSDRDGVFSTQRPDSSGRTALTSNQLDIGPHVITLTATDSDGLSTSASTNITVNDLPAAPSIAITPNPPDSDESLVVGVTFPAIDAEGHVMSYRYAWTKDGAGTSYSTTTVPASATIRGEKWAVTVTPNDGYGDGDSATASVTVGNAEPVLTSVSLTPSPAYNDSTLTCTPGSATDNDGDSISYSYAWTISGTTSAATSSTLSSSYFSRGDTVSCTVTPKDAYESGTAVTSSTVTISNSVPVITSASLTPTTAYEATTLTCSAGSTSDADGDSVSLTYAWTVNCSTISATSSTLTGTWFDKDDTVSCSITPSDGIDSGTAATSSTITIKNTAPTITSASLTPTTAYEATTITATPSGWYDIDGDSAGYRYQWYINGIAVTGATSDTLDYTEHVKGDKITVTVTAHDGTDAGTSVTSSSKTIQNSKPTAPVVLVSPTDAEPEDNLVCNISTASTDADGDSISYVYAWTVNGTASSITSSTVSYTYTAHSDSWTCTATPYDGTEYGSSGSDSQTVADRTAPNSPVINAIDEYRNSTSVTLTGTAEAGSTLTLYIDCDSGLKTQTTTVSSTGTWSITQSITQGDYCEYYAYATDTYGNVSTVSNTVGTESCDPFDDYEDSTTYGDTCSNAISEWSTLADTGASTISIVGNIIESTDEDWYVVYASQTITTSGTNTFHFAVTMIDGSDDYAFAVYKGSCSTSDLVCDDAGVEGDGYSEFEYFNEDVAEGGAYHLTPSDTRYCYNGTRYNTCTSYADYYYVHVFRTTSGYDCSGYELEITNGVW